MRSRVLRAAAELGYERNLLARGLRHDASGTVGAMFSDIANPSIAKIVKGAEHALRDAGYSMLLTDSEGRSELGVRHLRAFRQRRADGLIVMTAAEDDSETNNLLASYRAPIVVIDRELPPHIDAGYVVSDHATGLADATEHLIELGHRQFGLIVGPPIRPSLLRQETLANVLGVHGVEDGLAVITCDSLGPEQGSEATEQLLRLPEGVTAVILGGNQLAEGVLRTLRSHGLEPGRDLALVATDDSPLAELYQPSLSVVKRDPFEMGVVAGEMLIRRVRSEPGLTRVVLPTEYVARGSSIPPDGRRPIDRGSSRRSSSASSRSRPHPSGRSNGRRA